MSKKLTHEEFIARVIEKNEHVRNGEIEIRGMYVDSKTPVECYCKKHNYAFTHVPSVLYQGCGCKLCAVDRTSERYMTSHEDFLKKLYETNDAYRRGDFSVIGTYTGANKHIECYCNIHNKPWEPIPTNLYKGYACPICGKEKQGAARRNTHDAFLARVFESNLHVKNGDVEIRGVYNGIDNPIECYCVKHQVSLSTTPYLLEQGHGCPYCAGVKVLRGFNDLWTTNPDVASLLTNPDDGYLVAKMSHVKKNFTCPLCGTKQDKMVMNVTRRGLQCSNCSDHISFPNRFSRAFFSQLPVENYTPEYSPKWLLPYSFDNYFEYNGKRFVMENDAGIGHGNKQWGPGNKKDIEGKKRDELKDKLAAEQNVCVIRIDTQESTCEYIKNHILMSELAYIFDLSNIDWEKCDKDAQRNLVKEVCELYMSGMKNLKSIASVVQLSDQSVRNYLKRGSAFGWCDYTPRVVRTDKEFLVNGKIVVVTNESTGQQFQFNSLKKCASQIYDVCGIKVSHNTIRKYCNNSQPYKGFLFQFNDNNNTKLM